MNPEAFGMNPPPETPPPHGRQAAVMNIASLLGLTNFAHQSGFPDLAERAIKTANSGRRNSPELTETIIEKIEEALLQRGAGKFAHPIFD